MTQPDLSASAPLAAAPEQSPWDVAIQQYDRAADKLDLGPAVREVLRHPKREVTVHFPVELDDGTIRVFTGYRVWHNVVRGPAQLNTDLSAMKNFPISERLGRVQFRAEFFNALNQVRLANPGNVVSSGANFGRITSAGDPRLIQFGLKYMF